MTKEVILGFIRHALTFGGGFLTSGGIATGTDIEAGVGAIVTIVGIVWSIIHKKNAN